MQVDHINKFEAEKIVMVGFLPYFHIYGQTCIMNMCLYKKCKIVNVTKFDFVELLKIIETHKVTHAYVVPPVILALAKEPVVSNFDLSSLKEIISGAAPLGHQLTEMAQQRFHCPVTQGYGMTESSPVTTMSPIAKKGSVGLLIPNCKLKIVDPEDRKTLLGYKAEGELCFSGPNIMRGYLRNEKATAETIIDGWLHTGDIGYIDEDGYVHIVDRLKELIKYKGYQVPPAELEALLLKHENIADCAVIGVPDDESGEIPKAYVVKKNGCELTEEQVLSYVAENVSPIKKIRLVEFIDAIPKSASGKILRRVLRDSLKKE
jgi:4-coumarate--CoA ligase